MRCSKATVNQFFRFKNVMNSCIRKIDNYIVFQVIGRLAFTIETIFRPNVACYTTVIYQPHISSIYGAQGNFSVRSKCNS